MKTCTTLICGCLLLAAGALGATLPHGNDGILAGVPQNTTPLQPYGFLDLRAMWTFNSPSWTNANFGSGALTKEATAVPVQSDGYLTITSSTSYTISPASIAPSNCGCIAIRFQTTNSTANQYLVDFVRTAGDPVGAYENRLRFVSGNQYATAYSNSVAQWDVNASCPTGLWQNLILSWTNNQMSLYRRFDGSALTNIANDTSCTLPFTIGVARVASGNATGSICLQGLLGEVRLYANPKTSNEVVQIDAEMPWTSP